MANPPTEFQNPLGSGSGLSIAPFNVYAVFGDTSGVPAYGPKVNAAAVLGICANKGNGVVGQGNTGVWGIGYDADGTGVGGIGSQFGVYGLTSDGWGVVGRADGNGVGVLGSSGNPDKAGVHGLSDLGTGVLGECILDTRQNPSDPRPSGTKPGVAGRSNSGPGVQGISHSGDGVQGTSTDSKGVEGKSTNGYGVSGVTWGQDEVSGVIGINLSPGSGPHPGVTGMSASGHGVVGQSLSSTGAVGVLGSSLGTFSWAGAFDGDVYLSEDIHCLGSLYVTGKKHFRIDHPLDPENKYLNHASVESPDMKIIYDGVALLDDAGEAVVELPEYFEALNKDFCYQLTPIGASGRDLHIAERICNNRFKIGGGEPEMEVSWQVTGIRKDEWAEANPMVVEEDKHPEDRGERLQSSTSRTENGEHQRPLGKIRRVVEDHRQRKEEYRRMFEEHKERVEERMGQAEEQMRQTRAPRSPGGGGPEERLGLPPRPSGLLGPTL